MQICCLYMDASKRSSHYHDRLYQVKEALQSLNANISWYNAEQLQFTPCTGCFGCWVKTPGRCVFHDDLEPVLGNIIAADILLVVAPVYDGFFPAIIKKCFDRMIPLLHPYLEIVNKEVHHRKRYQHYPELALIIDLDDFDEEVRTLMNHWAERIVINMRSRLRALFSFSEVLELDGISQLLESPKTIQYG